MNSFNPPEYCPRLGHNVKGIAHTMTEGKRPVVVEHIQKATSILEVRDIETQRSFAIHRSDFIMGTHIPSRLRQYNFDTVAKFWGEALNRFPETVIIQPSSLSPETLARKIRDGREGKNAYGWTSPIVDESKWLQYANAISVTVGDNGNVIMGSRTGKMESAALLKTIGVLQTDSKSIVVSWTNIDDLNRFCKLIHDRAFSPRPDFVLDNLTPAIVADLESRYDIGFVPLENEPTRWQVI